MIPSLGLDLPVQTSQTIPDTTAVPPGCKPRAPGDTTQTVPEQGVTTPADDLVNRAWIFGHSRYQGAGRPFLSLQDISVGDEVFIDGTDRLSGAAVVHERYVVDTIYLTDSDSGDYLVSTTNNAGLPDRPEVILQTSVREDGPGKQWILNQQKVLAKAVNIVPGDLNDTCKYLLLFVVAKLA